MVRRSGHDDEAVLEQIGFEIDRLHVERALG
jgi:hypothetical protein